MVTIDNHICDTALALTTTHRTKVHLHNQLSYTYLRSLTADHELPQRSDIVRKLSEPAKKETSALSEAPMRQHILHDDDYLYHTEREDKSDGWDPPVRSAAVSFPIAFLGFKVGLKVLDALCGDLLASISYFFFIANDTTGTTDFLFRRSYITTGVEVVR